VAAIKQVPVEDAVRVAFEALDERAQLLALPPLTIEYVTDPVPEPPDVLKVGIAVYALPE
jgi:hypothetical protein